MELPGSKEGNVMMVGNKDAFKASVVDPEAIQKQNVRYAKEKEAVKALGTCVADNNLEPVLTLLLDNAAGKENKQLALQRLLQMNSLDCIDPLRNHEFRETHFEQDVNMAISQILKNNFKKECPYCSEIIKAQAKKCLHCKEDL
jgi:ABC-type transport system involved in cytochrome bd biosynthesis fused ATPase/permease subunit